MSKIKVTHLPGTDPMGSFPNKPQHYLRWYDVFPNISLIMRVMEGLPRYEQEALAEQLLALAREFERVLASSSDVKCLGPNIVLSLYKSKAKKRWYDDIPALHDALNLILTFPKPFQKRFDAKCSDIIMHLCDNKPPIMMDLPTFPT